MQDSKPKSSGLYNRYKSLHRGKKMILIIFLIWLLQAIPKWAVVIMADGQTSATIMRFFYTPRADLEP